MDSPLLLLSLAQHLPESFLQTSAGIGFRRTGHQLLYPAQLRFHDSARRTTFDMLPYVFPDVRSHLFLMRFYQPAFYFFTGHMHFIVV